MTTAGVFETLTRDVRYAVRGLRRSPLFTIVAMLTLAIGIGATTAVFSVVDGVLLKPLSYPNPDELVAVWHEAPGAAGLLGVAGGLNLSPSMLVTYREQNRSFEKIGLWTPGTASVTGLGEPEQVPGLLVTGQVLPALGVVPLLGRWIDEADEDINGPPITVLGYGYWQRRFGGDPNVIGKPITINGITAQIVGVMPRGFRIGDTGADLIGPYRFDRARLLPPPFCCFGVARLKRGVTLQQANKDLERLVPVWIDSFPFPGGTSGKDVYIDTWKIAPALRPLKADVLGNVGDLLWVVMAMIGIVLLVACANVANLLLVRGERRRQELAVRAALGAGSSRIARGLLAESLLLALGGGLIGVVIAYGALELLLGLAPPGLPRLADIALDGRALVLTLGVTIVAGLLFGLVPVLRGIGTRLSTGLRGGRGSSGGRAEHRTQNALVVGQVALALVLLVCSGLMIRTSLALRTVEPGFSEPETLQTFRIQIPDVVVADPVAVERQQHAIIDAIAATPGVMSAAFVSGLPMAGDGSNWDGVEIESRPETDRAQQLHVFRQMSPGFLRTMGARLIAGRELDWHDVEDPKAVALVSENLAREFWQDPKAALGQRIRPSGGAGPWREIVGVVEDVRTNGLNQPPPTTVYWPALMADFYRGAPFFVSRGIAVVVRSPLAGTPQLTRALEHTVWSVNAGLPLFGVRTMQDLYERSLARTSFTLVMLAIAGAAALVLGVVGLYGVLSYTISQRRREIAIRLALGAPQSLVIRSFVRYGAGLAVVGVVIGLVAAAGLTRLMGSLLYEVRALDPLTYVLVAVVLTLAAALASWLPARRAAAVDPAEVLNAE
jgi:predicted permease